MANADLSSYSLEDLVEMNNKLSVERAEATGSIKDHQLQVQKEIDRKTLLKRAEAFSDSEVKELAKMRREAPKGEEAPAEEDGE